VKITQDKAIAALNTLGAYLRCLTERGASRHALAGYRRDLPAFFAWFRETTGEEPEPAGVTGVDLREYQSFLRTRGLKPNAVNRKLKAVKSWLRWAAKEGVAPRVPEFTKDVPQAKAAPQALERAGVNRLLREPEKEVRPSRPKAEARVFPAPFLSGGRTRCGAHRN